MNELTTAHISLRHVSDVGPENDVSDRSAHARINLFFRLAAANRLLATWSSVKMSYAVDVRGLEMLLAHDLLNV